jgi:hypothetical protein
MERLHPQGPDASRRALLRAGAVMLPGTLALAGCGRVRDELAALLASNAWSQPVAASTSAPGLRGTAPARYSPLPRQPKLRPFSDPDFGTRMVRVTDAQSDFGAMVAMPAYPSTQAWNCDESRFILYVTGARRGGRQGWALFDGRSYRFLRFLDINPSDIEQFWWSQSDPRSLFYISNYELGSSAHSELTVADVESGDRRVVHDFIPDLRRLGWPSRGPVRAGYPFANGSDNRLWGLGAGGIPNIRGYLALNCFGFDAKSGSIVRYQGIDPAQQRTNVPAPRLSGKGWFWNDSGVRDDASYQTWVFDGSGRVLRKLPFSSAEHIDSAQDAAGHDLLVGVQFDTAVVGNMIVADLETGAVSTLVGRSNGFGYPRSGSFTSGTAYRNRSWIAGATVGSPFGTGQARPVQRPATLLDQEVFVANVDTKEVIRVAHHRSTGAWSDARQSNYWAQPNVTISPSGTRILVQSDWGCADPAHPVVDPSAAVDTYVIELAQYRV